MPLPNAIQNAPDLLPGLDLYYDGFVALTSCRNSMFAGEGPIPWLVMRDYCNDYGIVGEQKEYFFLMLGHMDNAYLEYKLKKSSR